VLFGTNFFYLFPNEHRTGVRLHSTSLMYWTERWMEHVRCCYLPFLCKIRHYNNSRGMYLSGVHCWQLMLLSRLFPMQMSRHVTSGLVLIIMEC